MVGLEEGTFIRRELNQHPKTESVSGRLVDHTIFSCSYQNHIEVISMQTTDSFTSMVSELRSRCTLKSLAVSVCFLLMFQLIVAIPASAQAGAANGAIAGTLTDTTGAAIPDGKITARNLHTGFSRTVSTDANGAYSVPLLPPDTYAVLVEKTGFASLNRTGITVDPDRTVALPLSISISDRTEVVTVSADAAAVSTEPMSETYLPQKSVENLQITERNALNFGLLSPGIAGIPSFGFSTPAYAFGGIQRRNFRADGMDNSQRAGQSKLAIFPPESTREVSVIQGAMLPEYGATVGGIINVTTRSGTNEYHGDILTLQRRPGFISRPSLAKVKAFQELATYEASVGGPFIKDKWWGFANFEYDPQTAAPPITINPTYASAIGIPASDLGNVPFHQTPKIWVGRTDFQVNQKTSGFLRLNYFGIPAAYNTQFATQPISTNNNFYDRDVSGEFQLTTALNAKTLNEFRFSDARRHNRNTPVSGTLAPVYAIPGVATINSNSTAFQAFYEHYDEFVDNISLQRRKHSFKVGADIETIHNNLVDRLAQTFTFGASGTNAVTGLPNSIQQYFNTKNGTTPTGYTQLTQQFGNNTADFRDTYMAFFAQDQWNIARNLMVSYGGRYAFIKYAPLDSGALLATSRSIPADHGDFAPHLGITYQPTPRTAIRAGYSILYDLTDMQYVGTAIRNNGTRVRTYTLAGTVMGAPAFPTGFTTEPTAGAQVSSVAGFDPNFKTLYAHQANLLINQDLGHDFGLEFGYQVYLGHRSPTFLDANLGAPTGTLADGRPVFGGPRPNTAVNQNFLVSSIGASNYNGAYIALTKRLSHGVEFSTSYTLSHTLNNNDSSVDTISSATGLPTSPGNLNFDYGNASDDQRHRFVFQGVFQPTVTGSSLVRAVFNGWSFAPDATVYSSFPINATAGVDLNKDGQLNDRPLFTARNSFRGPLFRIVDMRVGRMLKYHDRYSIEALAEAINLFNSKNAACNLIIGCTGAVVSTAGAADFGRVTAAYEARQLQVGARLRF